MPSRIELGDLIRAILGSENAYFQPPKSIEMNYPAVVYNLSNIENTYANDGVYLSARQYTLILIDKNPDSPLVEKFVSLPTCRFDRAYKADNMNHFVFTIYF